MPLAILVAATAGVADWSRQSAAPTAPRYLCRDLGTLGGTHAEATDLNNLGHVVGASRITGSSAVHAFLHDGEQLIDLGGQAGWANSKALGIDDAGRVVGEAMVSLPARQGPRGFLLDPASGRLRLLASGTQHGRTGAPASSFTSASTASALGSTGAVVGMTRFPNKLSHPHACLWGDGGPTDLGTLGGGSSTAHAVNRSGWVVGIAQTPSGDQRAFLWVSGTMQDLGMPGGVSSAAHDINDRGEIVGDAAIEGVVNHAFLWREGRMRDLGALPGGRASIAHAINNAGQIVGASDVPVRQALREFKAGSAERSYPHTGRPGAGERAVLWHEGAIYDLNRLCHAPGVLLFLARSINERGQIIANGLTPAGETHPFLLTPLDTGARRVPPPQADPL